MNATENANWQWISSYFPSSPNITQLIDGRTFDVGFQLDIVGFLAILGEGSVETISQVASLSVTIWLPRLIPAPQTFIRPSRAEQLESTSNAKVIGIHSGNSGEDIHHVAHALHRGDKLRPNTVTCVKVIENTSRPWPSIRRFGPLPLLGMMGGAMSCGLLILAVVKRDGMAIIATFVLSLLSTTTGIANKWKHVPVQPKITPHSPPADVVIKYPQGAFIIVSCEESTARYLYFNPAERCQYSVKSTTIYRGLSLISTLLLMAGVISLANSTIVLQTGFAVAYMSINIFYWIVAALPPSAHWDLSRLEVETISVHGGAPPREATIENENPTYTAALWKAIAVTGSKDWVREAGWAPKTDVWDDWLREAEEAATSEPVKVSKTKENGKMVEIWTIRNWDYRGRLGTLLKSRETNTSTFRKVEEGKGGSYAIGRRLESCQE